MNETEARTYREAYDAAVKRYSKMTRAALIIEDQAALADRGMRRLAGGPVTKDELIRDVLELRGYTTEKLNMTTHVLYHQDGAGSSACRPCHDRHGDLNCDCGLVSLHALCVCGHPRHKHWRDGSLQGGGCDTSAHEPAVRCQCRGYVTMAMANA